MSDYQTTEECVQVVTELFLSHIAFSSLSPSLSDHHRIIKNLTAAERTNERRQSAKPEKNSSTGRGGEQQHRREGGRRREKRIQTGKVKTTLKSLEERRKTGFASFLLPSNDFS